MTTDSRGDEGPWPDAGEAVTAGGVGEASALGRPGDEANPTLTGMAGRLLGDFRLIREVGRGGMGVVFEARQVSLGRRVAVKVLPSAAACDPRRLKRFGLEVQAAASLQHPHIVPVYAVGSDGGVPYYAMQYVEGRDLGRMLRDLRGPGEAATDPSGEPVATDRDGPRAPGGPCPPGVESTVADDPAPDSGRAGGPPTEPVEDEANSNEIAGGVRIAPPRDRDAFLEVARLCRQAAEALGHAHEAGIVHRDVKPANLMVDARGHLWVTDFGLARLQSDSDLTATGDLVGTLRYMPPEQLRGGRIPPDHRADIYALGATLYELATLAPAFAADDRAELLRRILYDTPLPPRRACPEVPRDLDRVILKAMEREPADRYPTAQALADDLGRFLAGEPVQARPVGPLTRLVHWALQPRRVRDAGLFLMVYGYINIVGTLLGVSMAASGHGPPMARPLEFYRDVAGTTLLDLVPATWLGWRILRGRSWALWVSLALAVNRIVLQGLILSGRFLKYGGYFDDPAGRTISFILNLALSSLVLAVLIVAAAAELDGRRARHRGRAGP